MSWKAAIASFALCLCASTAHAQTTGYVDWELIPQSRYDHPIMYVAEECRVIPHYQLMDVELIATRTPWRNGTLEQWTTITGVEEPYTVYIHTYVEGSRLKVDLVAAEEVGEDLFNTECRRHLPRLLTTIQQAFYGHYGLPFRENAQRAPP